MDLGILNVQRDELNRALIEFINQPQRYLVLGELKGGIDPAGADEHWKTAKTALLRIISKFHTLGLFPKTFFVGAAIQSNMASEIYTELQSGLLNYAANLGVDDQLTSLCSWLTTL